MQAWKKKKLHLSFDLGVTMTEQNLQKEPVSSDNICAHLVTDFVNQHLEKIYMMMCLLGFLENSEISDFSFIT